MYSTQDFPSKYYKMLHPFFKKKTENQQPTQRSVRPTSCLQRCQVSFPDFPTEPWGVWQFLSSGESWLYPGKHTKNYGKIHHFLMGKSTISVFIKNENLIRISFSGFELDSLNQQTWWFSWGFNMVSWDMMSENRSSFLVPFWQGTFDATTLPGCWGTVYLSN